MRKSLLVIERSSRVQPGKFLKFRELICYLTNIKKHHIAIRLWDSAVANHGNFALNNLVLPWTFVDTFILNEIFIPFETTSITVEERRNEAIH